MIFITVGHSMPFDRLLRSLDSAIPLEMREEVFAQIGPSRYEPRNYKWVRWLDNQEYDSALDQCSAVIAHAGTGTILQVLTRRKPLLVLPRLSSYGETRNDHQVGTASYFASEGQILFAEDESVLSERILELADFHPSKQISNGASPALIARVSSFMKASFDMSMDTP